ncbi:outer membrane protein assembly factor BamB family protein [Tsuneonella sp. HG222]
MGMTGLAGRIAAVLALACAGLAQAQQAAEFRPVTDAMIQQPDPADWLSWRRTLDSWGYSPLDQIDRETVRDLRMVWVRPLPDGHQEGTPLVHDGVMYFPGPGDNVQAIDAASGVVLWQHRRQLPADIGEFLPFHDTNRNLAIYHDLIIARGSDDVIYALDAKTGALRWETTIMDYRHGAKQSSGPIIADGLAITGRSCEPEGGPDACVITAHDALTGKEVWRTSTIARGDDPNDKSWGGLPLEQRQQVGAWMIASYDPELKLIYMGTSVTAPAPKISLAGAEHDYLYHNSTLALDVKTGCIVWHYQHLVDHWDLDHPFPRFLIDEAVAPDAAEVPWANPRQDRRAFRKVLTGVPGKTGIVYTLDRQTGQFLWARPTVFQNVVQSIDGRTGKVTLNPETVPTDYVKEHFTCPSASGGANYQAGAYSPLTKTMYFPAQNTCANARAIKPDPNAGPYAMATRQVLAPGAGDDVGVIHAINAITGKTQWKHSQRAGMQSLMTTGGGLVFAGDAAGRFRAMDDRTGAVLWEVNLGSAVTGYPATFTVGGHQYVAVSTGRWLNDTFTPEIVKGAQNAIFVFALPDAGIGAKGPVKPPVRIGDGVATTNDPALQSRAAPAPISAAGAAAPQGDASTGRIVYQQHCAACHGLDFKPAPGSPPVRGEAFMANWGGKGADALFAYIKSAMPPGQAGSLSDTEYRAVTAYVLGANRGG